MLPLILLVQQPNTQGPACGVIETELRHTGIVAEEPVALDATQSGAAGGIRVAITVQSSS